MVTRVSRKFKFAHFFLIIVIIIRCSEMFRVSDFIDGLASARNTHHLKRSLSLFKFAIIFQICMDLFSFI